MKKIFFLLLFLSFQVFLLAQDIPATPQEKTIDQQIDDWIKPLTDVAEKIVFFEIYNDGKLAIPFVLVWLIVGAIFYTIYMGFINIRGFRHALDVVQGKYDEPKSKGEVSHFQALTAALSGTVGVGNIGGVAIAISVGGPGATFWMIIAGLLGMTSKFVECTLGVKYRNYNSDGTVSGGPMYYLDKGLKNKGLGGLGKMLAVFFAIACIGGSFGGGNMAQVNQATQQLISVTGGTNSFLAGKAWIFGLVLSILVALVIIGGIKSIAKVTDKIVPAMVVIYLLGGFAVIIAGYQMIPTAFGKILQGAFTPESMYGGIIGVMITGFRRAVFSNEAGVGSASIAHSAAKTDHAISEGIVALLEPFIDTVIICTMTALVIIITGVYQGADPKQVDGVLLTSKAFASVISWFPIVLSIAVMLFALSTMISWSYYGLKAWTYLFGENLTADISYKIIFCTCIVLGSALNAKSVFGFSDAMIFAMCFPNILGLYILAPEVKKDLQEYLHEVKTGIIKKYH
jgi:AGCS family alanine or glycine:cation symporter